MPEIPKFTNTLIITQTSITEVDKKFVDHCRQNKYLQTIDLRNNMIRTVSPNLQKLKAVSTFYLSGNPYVCDCTMTWMVTWLQRQNNSTNGSLIRDHRRVTCENGKFKGIPITFLSDVLLGCYPSKWTTGQKAGVASGILFIACVFLILLIISRRSKEVKFLTYYYLKLNTLPKDDKKEETANKEYDAFFCYW